MSYFKSSLDKRLLDMLWNKYWVNTLSSSTLLTVSSQCILREMFLESKNSLCRDYLQFISEKYNAKGTVLSFKTVNHRRHAWNEIATKSYGCIFCSLTKFRSG